MIRWKTITYPSIYPNLYEISDDGQIRNKNTNKILVPYVLPCGYFVIKCKFINPINKKVGYKNFYIHKLVAWAFCELPEIIDVVDHLDGDKSNNHYTNLEWVRKGENTRRALKNGLTKIYGEDNYQNIYPESFVRLICSYLDSGLKKSDILKIVTKDANATCRQYSKIYALIVHLHMKNRFTDICNEYAYSPLIRDYTNDEILHLILSGYENIDIMNHYGYKIPNDNTALYSRILETRKQVINVQRLSKA